MEDKHRKLLCLGLFVLAILICFTTTGCEKENFTSGDIEGYHYEETEEVTNYVKIVTNHDQVTLMELYPDVAPITVENFQKLVSEHFYDGLIFHRVIEDFMIQGGDPNGNGTGGSGETIKGEFSSNGVENTLEHEPGVVSMARGTEPDSASSQFFICTGAKEDISYLDGDYAAFGKVIAGMNAVYEISKVSTDNSDMPLAAQRMETVRFVKVSELDATE